MRCRTARRRASNPSARSRRMNCARGEHDRGFSAVHAGSAATLVSATMRPSFNDTVPPREADHHRIVSRGDDRHVMGSVDVRRQFEQRFGRLRVEVGARLVREQQLRLRDDRTRDRNTLLLAARQFARSAIREVGDAQRIEYVERAFVPLLRRTPCSCMMNSTFSRAESTGIRLYA